MWEKALICCKVSRAGEQLQARSVSSLSVCVRVRLQLGFCCCFVCASLCFLPVSEFCVCLTLCDLDSRSDPLPLSQSLRTLASPGGLAAGYTFQFCNFQNRWGSSHLLCVYEQSSSWLALKPVLTHWSGHV